MVIEFDYYGIFIGSTFDRFPPQSVGAHFSPSLHTTPKLNVHVNGERDEVVSKMESEKQSPKRRKIGPKKLRHLHSIVSEK